MEYAIERTDSGRRLTIYGEIVDVDEEHYQALREAVLSCKMRGSYLLSVGNIILRSSDVTGLRKLMKLKRN